MRMSTYDLYAFKGVVIADAKSKVEDKFDFSFEEKDSAYQGGIYYKFESKESEGFILKENIDPFDGMATEQAFSKYKILLYVNGTPRSDEVKTLLGPDFLLLRHEKFD